MTHWKRTWKHHLPGAIHLCELAEMRPDFRGDFWSLAEEIGWTSGPKWRLNPAIRMAGLAWFARRDSLASDLLATRWRPKECPFFWITMPEIEPWHKRSA